MNKSWLMLLSLTLLAFAPTQAYALDPLKDAREAALLRVALTKVNNDHLKLSSNNLAEALKQNDPYLVLVATIRVYQEEVTFRRSQIASMGAVNDLDLKIEEGKQLGWLTPAKLREAADLTAKLRSQLDDLQVPDHEENLKKAEDMIKKTFGDHMPAKGGFPNIKA